MIHELQRAHSRLQYVLVMPPVLIAVACVYGIMQTYSSLFSWIYFGMMIIGNIFLAKYILTRFKQIFFDNSFIYINSFFGKPEGRISYHDVIRVEVILSRPHYPRGASGLHRLTYNTEKTIRKISFFPSFYTRQVDLFKRQISPEKIME